MTEQDLRVKIAEAKGWTDCRMCDDGQPWGCYPGEAFGQPLPNYPGDPREYVPLLEEMRDDIYDIDPAPEGEWIIQLYDDDDAMHCAPTLGRAVCLAWLAWHTARSGEGE